MLRCKPMTLRPASCMPGIEEVKYFKEYFCCFERGIFPKWAWNILPRFPSPPISSFRENPGEKCFLCSLPPIFPPDFFSNEGFMTHSSSSFCMQTGVRDQTFPVESPHVPFHTHWILLCLVVTFAEGFYERVNYHVEKDQIVKTVHWILCGLKTLQGPRHIGIYVHRPPVQVVHPAYGHAASERDRYNLVH